MKKFLENFPEFLICYSSWCQDLTMGGGTRSIGSTWPSTTKSIYLERSRRAGQEYSIIVIISYRFENLFRVKVGKSAPGINKCTPPINFDNHFYLRFWKIGTFYLGLLLQFFYSCLLSLMINPESWGCFESQILVIRWQLRGTHWT